MGVLFDNWLLARTDAPGEVETSARLSRRRSASPATDTNLDLCAQIRRQPKGRRRGSDRPRRGGGLRPGQRREVRRPARQRRLLLLHGFGRDDRRAHRRPRCPRSATIDFTELGSAGHNFNAPTSVVNAAVLYVFRTPVAADDIPLQRRLPAPVAYRRPRRPDARTNPSRRGGRWQRRKPRRRSPARCRSRWVCGPRDPGR